MYTTYHLSSAQEITIDRLESIKTSFKTRAIKITVEEEIDTTSYLMSNSKNKEVLENSLRQAKNKEFIEVKL